MLDDWIAAWSVFLYLGGRALRAGRFGLYACDWCLDLGGWWLVLRARLCPDLSQAQPDGIRPYFAP